MQLAGGGALIAAFFTEVKFKKELSSSERGMIDLASYFLDQNELFLKTEAMAGIVFGVSGVAVVFGFISSIGRMFHLRHTNTNYWIFACLVNFFCFLLIHIH